LRFIPPQMDDVDDDLVNWEVPENRLIFAVILLAVADCRPSIQRRLGNKGADGFHVEWVKSVMTPEFLDKYFREDVKDFCEQIAHFGKEDQLYNQILRAKKRAENYKPRYMYTKQRLWGK